MTQLLLNGPWGWNSSEYVSVSLLSDSQEFDSEKVTSTLLEYSCYPSSIPKILSCLKYSGRYDCLLQRSWFRNNMRYSSSNPGRVDNALLTHGIVLRINYEVIEWEVISV